MPPAHWNGWIPPDPRPADPHAVPMYGVASFTPLTGCPHDGAIRKGSYLYCEVCAAYGRDYDKRLVIDERERPKPEPVVTAIPLPPPNRAEERTGKPTSGKMARRKAKKAKAAEVVESQAA